MPSITLLGATGLVGRHCLDLLASDRAFERIVVVARRKFAEAMAPRVEAHIVDMAHLEERPDLFAVDQIICALGTTMRAVGGSLERFRHVDYDIPLSGARLGQRQGARQFLLVSAIGAAADSWFPYNRIKGDLENELRTIGYRSVTILRPSLLLGDRAEFRLGEELGKRVGWLLPGRYRPVHARDVAKVLVVFAKRDEPGLHLVESDEIRAIAAAH